MGSLGRADGTRARLPVLAGLMRRLAASGVAFKPSARGAAQDAHHRAGASARRAPASPTSVIHTRISRTEKPVARSRRISSSVACSRARARARRPRRSGSRRPARTSARRSPPGSWTCRPPARVRAPGPIVRTQRAVLVVSSRDAFPKSHRACSRNRCSRSPRCPRPPTSRPRPRKGSLAERPSPCAQRSVGLQEPVQRGRAHAELARRLAEGQAARPQGPRLHQVDLRWRPAHVHALAPDALEPGLGALHDARPLPLGDPGEDRDQQRAHRPRGVEPRLAHAHHLDPRRSSSSTTERLPTIERPKRSRLQTSRQPFASNQEVILQRLPCRRLVAPLAPRQASKGDRRTWRPRRSTSRTSSS